MGDMKEYYTVREVANITGLTVQSVYNRIDKAEKDTGKSYSFTDEDKVKRVSADFLRDCYGITGDEEEEARKLDLVARLEAELQREKDRNADEVARLNLEIDRLHSEIEMLMKMNLNNQVLLLQAKPTAETAPEDDKPIKNKPFWNIFSKRND